jgi:uncharacterized membrane protein YeaQ/YmgE (transglycosylase-associated protein family)
MSIIELALLGLVVGAVARLLVPGPQPMGILMTMAVGVGGSLLGWWIGQHLVGGRAALHPWLWAIGGAVVLVLVYTSMAGRRGMFRRHGMFR